jgi:hypothetical protein
VTDAMNAPHDSAVTQSREHAWKYFELHANQRIAVFNFFLVFSGALAAGIAATLQGSQRFALLGVGLGLTLGLVAFLFWKLDQRVSFLIKRAERALSDAEGAFPDPTLRLFQHEPSSTIEASKGLGPVRRLWTYGEVFRLMFAAMAVSGVVGTVLCWLRFTGHLDW